MKERPFEVSDTDNLPPQLKAKLTNLIHLSLGDQRIDNTTPHT